MFHLSRFLAGCRLDASGADWPVNAQRVFLGFVAFCLFAPLVQTLYPVFGKTIVSPIEERRSANPFPSMQLLAATNGNFAAELNKWFDDRVGFRDLFIRAKNQADYTVFHTSTKVYVGADGWLFYRYPIDSIANVDAASLSALEASYLALARLLNERGIHLIVVGYPLKAAIYPEMAPPDMPVRPRGGTYDQFRSFLSTRSELTFVDAEEIIKGLKITSSELLYAKGDIHATHFAQRAVVKEIIARIAHAEGRPDIRWDEKMTLMHLRWRTEGVERNALAVLSPPREDIPVLKGFYYIGGQESDGYWNLPDPKILDRAYPGFRSQEILGQAQPDRGLPGDGPEEPGDCHGGSAGSVIPLYPRMRMRSASSGRVRWSTRCSCRCARDRDQPAVVVIGHSFGGRIATWTAFSGPLLPPVEGVVIGNGSGPDLIIGLQGAFPAGASTRAPPVFTIGDPIMKEGPSRASRKSGRTSPTPALHMISR